MKISYNTYMKQTFCRMSCLLFADDKRLMAESESNLQIYVIVVPTTLYDSEASVLENEVKNRVEVAGMSCLRSMCEVTRGR